VTDATLTRVRDHQTILLDFARMAAETTELQRLLDLSCHHAARAVGVAHSKVMQFRRDKGDLLIVAGRGWKPGVVGQCRLGIDMLSPPGRSYQTRDVVRTGNLQEDPNLRVSAVLREHDIRSVLNAPIAIEGIVWGVIEVDSVEADRFDVDDEKFLFAFALILALAVRHRLAQEEREHNAEELNRRLTQADTLLSEQNHRVRNYFQLILSILANRRRQATDDHMRREHDALMERITAVALAHDQLTFGGESQTHINAATYIEALCLGIEHATEESLRIELDVTGIEVRADRLVPVGLILNELLTNAIKYAAKDRNNSTIRVQLAYHSEATEAVLTVSDDGPGIKQQRDGSMGLKLVETLAAQISGRLHIDSSPKGTAITLTFPLVE
jgi:two-component system, sensor histidine kinase PdtaS